MKSLVCLAACLFALTSALAQSQSPQNSKPRYIKVSGGVLQGIVIKKVSPLYPPIAKAARASGKVEVQITVSEQGKVIEATVVSGHPLLRDAAVAAAKQWVFKPTELSGVPVKVQGVLTFNFTLHDSDPAAPEAIPSNAREYLARGESRMYKDDAQGAIADFTKAIELDPQFVDGYSGRALARLTTNDLDGSLADANKAIEINPRSAEAYLVRGSVRLHRLDLDGSIADLSRAIELNPKAIAAWHERGVARNSRGDLDGGIADLSKAIALHPFGVNTYKERGAARRKQGDLQGATADFNKVIDLNPNDPEAYNKRGEARLDKGDKTGALADFNKAIELDPNYGSAYFNRSSIHRANGDLDKAAADFVRANEEPGFVKELWSRASLYRKLEEKEISQAIAANPRDAQAYGRRVTARIISGDLDGAIADATKVIDLEPRDAKSYDNRGALLMSKDDLDGAIADFTKAIKLDPKSPLFYVSRGSALLLQGKEAEARRDFDRCLELNPNLKPGLERQIKAIKERRASPNREIVFRRHRTTPRRRDENQTAKHSVGSGLRLRRADSRRGAGDETLSAPAIYAESGRTQPSAHCHA